ncbi:hypothetical protein MOD31_00155 [Paenarthrobacter sp. TYUT067]|uniref:DUF6575 domain-containing protein n=1 Tax=Paenarthrobacter sp. TYUT067 TaxID=2926245 RepID=UPI00202FAFB7|nr:DUF6575 domain-containing protein [Paenarthrobacter sp. TYUT067]MCM0614428.1 hypothetical protein [Paenarthrobacter sp. TYUT067]
MGWLPTNTLLGDLELEEVFVEYDGPRLFTCRSRTDQKFIAGWAEEGVDRDLWLYVPVSTGRLSAVRSGGINLRDAYLRPEGFLYVATLYHQGDEPDTVVPIRPTDVLDDWLPASDFALNLDTPTAEPALDPENLERLAVQEGRTRLDVQVHLPDYYRTEAPTRAIGLVLVALQGVLENFGALELLEEPPQAGALPIDVTSALASNVLALSAASFVLGIAATDGQDLFGESPFSKAVERLVTMAADAADSETVAQEVLQLKPRGARSYSRLIRQLAETKGDVTLNAGSPQFGKRTAKLTAEKLDRLSQLLDAAIEQEPTEIRGRMTLVAADSEHMRFGLRDVESDVLYQGKVSAAALPEVSRATIHDEYEVILTEVALDEAATGQTKFTYTLEQLSHMVDGSSPQSAPELPAAPSSAPTGDDTP